MKFQPLLPTTISNTNHAFTDSSRTRQKLYIMWSFVSIASMVVLSALMFKGYHDQVDYCSQFDCSLSISSAQCDIEMKQCAVNLKPYGAPCYATKSLVSARVDTCYAASRPIAVATGFGFCFVVLALCTFLCFLGVSSRKTQSDLVSVVVSFIRQPNVHFELFTELL